MAAAALVLLGAPALQAQSVEYTLEPEQGWRQTRAPEPGSDEAVVTEARAALAQDRPGRALAILNRWIAAREAAGRTDNPWMAEALLLRGDALLALGREYSALFDYERIARQHPASDAFVAALQREHEIALRYLNGLKRRFLGLRIADATDIGEELLIRIQERLPGSQLAEQAAIALADYYYRVGKMDLAATAYDLYLQNYPRGERRLHAMRRRIFANLAQFKGPAYDTTSLLDAREQILQLASLYPQQAGDVAPVVARIDDSLAARRLDAAKWRLKRGDDPGARLILRRILRDHPRSAAAAEALAIMARKGWIESPPAPQPSEEQQPSGAADPERGL